MKKVIHHSISEFQNRVYVVFVFFWSSKKPLSAYTGKKYSGDNENQVAWGTPKPTKAIL